MVREYRRRLFDAEEELAQFRAVDPVTGAGTYSQLKASLDAELARSRRYGRPAACLMFGFDDYAGLRYKLGREACDAYLTRLFQGVLSCLRSADRLFRIDSDEFVMLLPETDLPGGQLVAQRILDVMKDIVVEGTNGPLGVTARCGGAVFPARCRAHQRGPAARGQQELPGAAASRPAALRLVVARPTSGAAHAPVS